VFTYAICIADDDGVDTIFLFTKALWGEKAEAEAKKRAVAAAVNFILEWSFSEFILPLWFNETKIVHRSMWVGLRKKKTVCVVINHFIRFRNMQSSSFYICDFFTRVRLADNRHHSWFINSWFIWLPPTDPLLYIHVLRRHVMYNVVPTTKLKDAQIDIE